MVIKCSITAKKTNYLFFNSGPHNRHDYRGRTQRNKKNNISIQCNFSEIIVFDSIYKYRSRLVMYAGLYVEFG